MTGNTLFITYILKPTGITAGYSQAIHCNYIKKINLGGADPYIQEISLNFTNNGDFKFLGSTVGGTGYTANEIYGLIQIVDNTDFDVYDDIQPDSTAWKSYNLTDQITGYGGVLTPTNIVAQVYKIPLLNYLTGTTFTSYNLNYLNYPEATNPDKLVFGDVTYFFGNVETDIKADVYTTDLNIILPLNEFNSTTNSTWDGQETVFISEIGIFDADNNLVAIGKLNNPVPKDDSIGRTIVFALDF